MFTILVIVVTVFNRVFCPAVKAERIGSGYVNNELIISEQEKLVFEKFKSETQKYHVGDVLFIKDDLFLLRFLRELAKRNWLELYEFQAAANFSTILNEDWSAVAENNPFCYTHDLEMRLVAYSTVRDGSWNIQAAAVTGGLPRLIRYVYKVAVEAAFKLEEIRQKHPNVTQLVIIMDLEGFNRHSQMCSECVAMYLRFAEHTARWIPTQYVYAVVAVNAPHEYYSLIRIIQPYLPQKMNAMFKVFDGNKIRWKSYLDKRIDPNLLPSFLLGNKNDEC